LADDVHVFVAGVEGLHLAAVAVEVPNHLETVGHVMEGVGERPPAGLERLRVFARDDAPREPLAGRLPSGADVDRRAVVGRRRQERLRPSLVIGHVLAAAHRGVVGGGGVVGRQHDRDVEVAAGAAEHLGRDEPAGVQPIPAVRAVAVAQHRIHLRPDLGLELVYRGGRVAVRRDAELRLLHR
jgi:hypothetical protein